MDSRSPVTSSFALGCAVLGLFICTTFEELAWKASHSTPQPTTGSMAIANEAKNELRKHIPGTGPALELSDAELQQFAEAIDRMQAQQRLLFFVSIFGKAQFIVAPLGLISSFICFRRNKANRRLRAVFASTGVAAAACIVMMIYRDYFSLVMSQ